MKKNINIVPVAVIVSLLICIFSQRIIVSAEQESHQQSTFSLEILKPIPVDQLPETPGANETKPEIDKPLDLSEGNEHLAFPNNSSNQKELANKIQGSVGSLPATGQGLAFFGLSYVLLIIGLILKTERRNQDV